MFSVKLKDKGRKFYFYEEAVKALLVLDRNYDVGPFAHNVLCVLNKWVMQADSYTYTSLWTCICMRFAVKSPFLLPPVPLAHFPPIPHIYHIQVTTITSFLCLFQTLYANIILLSDIICKYNSTLSNINFILFASYWYTFLQSYFF